MHCSNLTSVSIGNLVTIINGESFSECYELTNIIFRGTISEWNNITLDSNWKGNSPITTIHCTDGDVTVS